MIVRCLLYFGWIWAFVTVGLGIIVAFMLRGNNYLQYPSRKGNPLFLYGLCNWGFILMIWLAIAFTYKKNAYSNKTMIAYAILNTISATFFTVYTYSQAAQKLSEFVAYFLGNATAYTATTIASLCCLDWMTEKIDDIELGNTSPANIECDNDSQVTLTEDWIQRRSR
ncbi:hypothetical protein BDF21DRAFT_479693 [Thamnidium elegans]|nr:hypothetical protein BDF21DRAFT_479693 [Thamnidium elegans]